VNPVLIQGCRFEEAALSRGDLTEVEWRILRVLLPIERAPGRRGRGRPPGDNRNVINGILWRLRTGAPWRDVPEKYGNWNSIYRRFRRWSASGVWESVAIALAETMAESGHYNIGSSDGRVERVWRREGLKVPHKQPKRGRLWLGDGSRIRLRPERPNHVWSYDFVEDSTHDGRKYLMLNVLDEFTHECLAIRINRRLKSADVIDVLSDLFILRGVPGHIRSDNGPEFVAKALQEWVATVGAKTAYI
jgi:transposase